jgi:hypothetical protein
MPLAYVEQSDAEKTATGQDWFPRGFESRLPLSGQSLDELLEVGSPRRARPDRHDGPVLDLDLSKDARDQDVRGRQEGLKLFKHPELGRIDLEFTAFQVAEQPSLRLYVYAPADARSETKLRETATGKPASA